LLPLPPYVIVIRTDLPDQSPLTTPRLELHCTARGVHTRTYRMRSRTGVGRTGSGGMGRPRGEAA